MARHAPARPGAAGDDRAALALRRPTSVRLGVGAVVVLVLAGLLIAVVLSLLGASGQVRTLTAPSSTATSDTADGTTKSGAVLYIHVLGEVASPGVYQLRDGDRVFDAIAAAGGFTPAADQRSVNLARFLSDGEQILVPAQGAAPPPAATPGSPEGGQVNLNTATSAELETLPRVGPAMAERILAWREENGRFTSVDDLLAVAGIGDKTFESLKDLVTV